MSSERICDGVWIQTATGRKFDLLSPYCEIEDMNIEDIAHALSQICRFGGHTREFYSVAQHSVLVCDNVPEGWRYEALMHDAAEAYTGDFPSPLKVAIPELKRADGVVKTIGRRVADRFCFSPEPSPFVIEADIRALVTEARDLLDGGPIYHWTEKFDVEPFLETIDPLPPRGAKELFLDRWHRLSESK